MVKGFEYKVGAMVPPMSTFLYPQMLWSEFVHVLGFLEERDLRSLGCTSLQGFTIQRREVNRRYGELGEGGPRFLSRRESAVGMVVTPNSERLRLNDGRILLSSYPRSGNSYLRGLLEGSTGIITGSDSRPNRNLSASLIRFGFQGEGVVDQSVWLVKSHYPERFGYARFEVGKAILLVRNPFDAIASYFNMAFTNTHDKVLHPSAREAPSPLAGIWEDFVLEEAGVWLRFHDFWGMKAREMPVLTVRFEDLGPDSQEELHAFLGCEGGGGGDTVLTKSSGAGYGPKAHTRSFGKALSLMSDLLVEKLQGVLGPALGAYGYELQPGTGQGGGWTLKVLPLPTSKSPFVASSSSAPLVVNDHHDKSGLLVRGRKDKYGRRVTDLRHSLTDNDSRPFPVSE